MEWLKVLYTKVSFLAGGEFLSKTDDHLQKFTKQLRLPCNLLPTRIFIQVVGLPLIDFQSDRQYSPTTNALKWNGLSPQFWTVQIIPVQFANSQIWDQAATSFTEFHKDKGLVERWISALMSPHVSTSMTAVSSSRGFLLQFLCCLIDKF